MFINESTLVCIDDPSFLEIEDSNIILNERINFKMINQFISNHEIDQQNKVLLIATVISWIRTEELLFSTISLLKEFGWYKSESKFQQLTDYVEHNEEYSDKDITKFKALTYSFVLKYEILMSSWSVLFDLEKPKLELWVEGRSIKTNILSVENYVRTNTLSYLIDEYIEPLDIEEQGVILQELIYSMAKIDYENNTESLSKDISLLEKRAKLNEQRNNVEGNKSRTNINLYPRIFVSDFAFRVFERMRDTVENPIADYSFIYRKMVKDGFIFESVGDSEFRSWLSSNYEVEIIKTKQLHNCTTEIKEQLYTSIKDLIKQ